MRAFRANVIIAIPGYKLGCWDSKLFPTRYPNGKRKYPGGLVKAFSETLRRNAMWGGFYTGAGYGGSNYGFGEEYKKALERDGYYCLLHGPFRERWTQLVQEWAPYRVLVDVLPDEMHVYESHSLKCPQCRGRFKELHGVDPPAKLTVENASLWAKWTLLRYQMAAEAAKHWVDAAKEANPEARTVTSLAPTSVIYSQRAEQGLAWDLLGQTAGIDYLCADPYITIHRYSARKPDHYYVSETTKHLVAANRKGRAGVILEPETMRDYLRMLRPVEVYGCALTAVANGASLVTFFRGMEPWDLTARPFAYLPAERQSEMQRRIRLAFRLLQDIEPWLLGSSSPSQIVLLYSRASEDFYRGRKPRGFRRAYACDAHSEVLRFLFASGCPFRMRFLDQLREEDLAGARLLVLPFPYSVPREKARVLERAVRRGARLLAISEYGQMDEDGDEHTRPALLDLLGLKEVRVTPVETKLDFLPDSPILPGYSSGDFVFSMHQSVKPSLEARQLIRGDAGGVVLHKLGEGETLFLGGEFGMSKAFYGKEWIPHRSRFQRNKPYRTVLSACIDYLLGGSKTLRFKRTPDDVEVTLREQPDGAHVLFVLNWENDVVQVEFGLNLPKARYRITERNLQGFSAVRFPEGEEVSQEALTNIELALRPNDVRIWFIAPVGHDGHPAREALVPWPQIVVPQRELVTPEDYGTDEDAAVFDLRAEQGIIVSGSGDRTPASRRAVSALVSQKVYRNDRAKKWPVPLGDLMVHLRDAGCGIAWKLPDIPKGDYPVFARVRQGLNVHFTCPMSYRLLVNGSEVPLVRADRQPCFLRAGVPGAPSFGDWIAWVHSKYRVRLQSGDAILLRCDTPDSYVDGISNVLTEDLFLAPPE